MKKKVISILEQSLLKYTNNEINLEGWRSATLITLERIYGKDSIQASSVINIKYWLVNDIDNSDACKKNASNLIDSLILDIETFGITKKEDSQTEIKSTPSPANIIINNSNQQSQEQSIDLKIITKIIEDHLTTEQLGKIKKILESNENDSSKKMKISDLLTQFGSDVTTNIAASLLIATDQFKDFIGL